MVNQDKYEWAICILSSRENSSTLLESFKSTYIASQNKKTIIDIVVNGNLDLAKNLAKNISLSSEETNLGNKVRIWHLKVSDKASAWNFYLHHIWPGSDLVFFIDGYVKPWSDSMIKIQAGLASNINSLASSGVPTEGRPARSLRENMIQNGGIHGNLYAVKGNICQNLKEIDFFLPTGLYRTDPVLAAVLAFNLNPFKYSWELKKRIIVNAEASWSLATPQNLTLGLLSSLIKRSIRQAQGKLENSAVRNHFSILKKSPGELPRRVDHLIDNWIKANYSQAVLLFISNPLCIYSYFKLNKTIKSMDDNFSQYNKSLIAEGYYIK